MADRFMKRWPMKPPPGTRCEGSVGWEPDWTGSPVLKVCPKLADETVYVSETMPVQMYVCQSHAPLGYRNPRHHPPVPVHPEVPGEQ